MIEMKPSWNLVADIGGTNARFAVLLTGEANHLCEFHYSVEQQPQFQLLIESLMQQIAGTTGWSHPPSKVCFAVACPVDMDPLVITNCPWQFSRHDLQQTLDCDNILIINDFAAMAYGVQAISDADVTQIGIGRAIVNKPIAILGAGTGLGMAALIPGSSRYQVIETEGGHADFAPLNDLQIHINETLKKEYGHVSLERLLSGPGLLNIYKALAGNSSDKQRFQQPRQLVEAALHGRDETALQVLELFSEVMGAAAGNLALTYGARGGVYITGGVIPRFEQLFIASRFRQKFEDKGRFRPYLSNIPTFLVTRDNLGLFGAAMSLNTTE
ncbi:MAG: glucokinase [Gammaproteobacteria bacterium]|jgi:glucokinase|nr:glucokinase [Gammaproteobacteria bacterium]MBT5201999.1 glucokinase [Gammaproteobacteria bacterium]MBT5603654.1 glucokinase [Gammaproteobacteria bacterium]MBT6246449.1 glucokinase [Gammaproteobacteria bacterium]MBT7719324.1 glucokinase [Halieaceae bacterium]